MIKKFVAFILIILSLLFISCEKDTGIDGQTDDSTDATDTTQPEYSNPEMDKFVSDFIAAWQNGNIASLYANLSEEYAGYMSESDFAAQFNFHTDFGGPLLEVTDQIATDEGAAITYSLKLAFEHFDADFVLSIGNSADNIIFAYSIDYRFRQKPVDIDRGNGVYERLFLFDTGEHQLNASYIYFTDGGNHTTALIIPEYGYTDINYTYGANKTYYDLANSLAEKGIGSFRMEKNSYRYGYNYLGEYTVEDEFFNDYRNAIDFVKNENTSGDLVLVGHSFGSSIAANLAAEDNDIKKIVSLNGTVKTLAESMKDFSISLDPGRITEYEELYATIFSCTEENATGERLHSLSDYYWASTNMLNTPEDLKTANIPVLAINSYYDIQHIESDIDLWKKEAQKNKNIETIVYDRMSFVLYEVDITDIFSIYRSHDIPEYLIDDIANFILK